MCEFCTIVFKNIFYVSVPNSNLLIAVIFMHAPCGYNNQYFAILAL